MNPKILQDLGLTKSQAIVYLKLVEKGELAPPVVAELAGETRSNAYMILQKLEELGLVEKLEKAKKITYQPLNPVALESLAEKKRQQVLEVENQIKHVMPQMLTYFYSFTEKPGIRLLQGKEGLKEIYSDTIRTKEDIYFLRTPSEVEVLGHDYFERYKKKRVELDITTYAYTASTPKARWRKKTEDKLNKMIRTLLKPEDYTAPVEVTVYGDKVAFLSYGEELMGVIIQSPTIAESMRQVFKLIGKKR